MADTGTYTGTGAVYKFTPAGVRTTFASGLNFLHVLWPLTAQGNLFVLLAADETTPSINLRRTGAPTTFATVQLGAANGLAFDRAGNLFVAAGVQLFQQRPRRNGL